jgi:DNA-binding transcriptional regulator YiaG
MDNGVANLMDRPKRIRHHRRRMSRRIRMLLAEAEAWCDQERGRRTQLARYLNVSLPAVSTWFREYKKPHPTKQPTAEQTLGIQEFLAQQGQGQQQRRREPFPSFDVAMPVAATATPETPSATDTLLEELKRWCDAQRGRRARLPREISVPPQLVTEWFAGRKTPTWEQGLRIQSFLAQHR